MADLFNRQSDAFGGSFSADGAFVSFAMGDAEGVGMLTQSLSVGYQQQITRIYEIGSNFHFYVAGRTMGNMGMGRVLGPRPIAIAFYAKYGDVCRAASNILDITLATGCDFEGEFLLENATFTFSVMFCVINSIAITVAAQDMIINEQLSLTFASLDVFQI